MEKEFLSYEHTVEISKLGFNEECLATYNKKGVLMLDSSHRAHTAVSAAPLYQQAFKWFREKYNYQHIVQYFEGTYFSCVRDSNTWSADRYDTYEEAELACLIKLIEIAKNK